jgi:hypothetical protein
MRWQRNCSAVGTDRNFGVPYRFYCSGAEISAVDQYLNELLLLLSVVGAPIILGALIFLGMTISGRRQCSERDDSGSERIAVGGKRRQG